MSEATLILCPRCEHGRVGQGGMCTYCRYRAPKGWMAWQWLRFLCWVGSFAV